jgi:trk system potassium uptake protein TrkA
LPTVTILNGDGTNLAFLEEERINNADIFIAATPSDEANIMSAIQAKNLGVQKTLVVIHRPDYAGLVEKIGVDKAVSPRVVMAKEILTFLRKGSISVLAELGEIEILEMVVGGEEFVGKKLKDLKLPDESLVLTLLRDNDLVVPTADTIFQLNDVVLIICKHTIHKRITKLVTGRN